MIVQLCAALLLALVFAPNTPFSRAICKLLLKISAPIAEALSIGRVLWAIGIGLLIYAGIMLLPPDVVVLSGLMMPELAIWFATFEIGTLVEALVAVGFASASIRAAGLHNFLRYRFARRAPRQRRNTEKTGVANDDDHHPVLELAA